MRKTQDEHKAQNETTRDKTHLGISKKTSKGGATYLLALNEDGHVINIAAIPYV